MTHRPVNFVTVLLLLAALLLAGGCASLSSATEAESAAAESPTSTATPARVPTNTPAPTATNTTVVQSTATASPTPSPTVEPTATPQPTEPPPIEHVVIISIDGLRPDAWDLADTPTLDALRLAGAYSPQARAVVPSVTLVNHASMLGGMAPEKHGIDWNDADSSRGKINGPTLFSVAHEAGYSTAMVVGKPKLEHLVLPGSVDSYIYAGYTDMQVTAEAIAVIEAGLPDVLFIHLPDVDSAGHLAGWMSPGQLLALNLTDGQIAKIVSTLEASDDLSRALLLIVSDHGGSGTSHGSDSPEDTLVPWLAVGPGVPQGVTLNGSITTYDTAATALRALNLPIPPEWDGRPVLEIFNN